MENIFSGKTVEDAIQNGLNALNITLADATVTVIEEGKKGILGIGSKPAKVKIEVKLETEEVETTINIPSMRLDAVISSALKISRNDACKMITTGLVRINHVECLDIDKKINVSDMLSIRKYGRITILEIVKTTRKDRLVVKIGVKH